MISVTAAAGLGGSMVLREFDANGVPVPGAGLQSREGDRDRDPVQCPDRRRGYSARRNVEFGVGGYELFGVKPTTFAEFARRHASALLGEG